MKITRCDIPEFLREPADEIPAFLRPGPFIGIDTAKDDLDLTVYLSTFQQAAPVTRPPEPTLRADWLVYGGTITAGWRK